MGIAEKAVPFSFAVIQFLECFRLALFRRFFACGKWISCVKNLQELQNKEQKI